MGLIPDEEFKQSAAYQKYVKPYLEKAEKEKNRKAA